MQKEILEEDEYINRLENIIQRDFFPDLNRIRAQIERMKSGNNGDVMVLPKISAEPSTPLSITTEETNEALGEESLNSFFNRCTSEDNSSFSVLLEKMKKKHQQQMNFLYQVNNQHKVLALEAGNSTAAISTSVPKLENSKNSSALVLASNGSNAVQFSKLENLHENNFFFMSSATTTKQYSEENDLAGPKETNFNQTRFSSKALEALEKPVPKEKKDDADNVWHLDYASEKILQSHNDPHKKKAGAEEHYNLDQLLATPSAELLEQIHGEKKEPDTPQIGGYKLLRTPVIHSVNEDDLLMTWGTMDSTPLQIDTLGGHNPFKVPEPPKREVLSHKLANKAGRELRKRQQMTPTPNVRGTPSGNLTPSSPFTPQSQRLSSMSPAAQRLAASLKGGASPSIFGSSPLIKSSGITPSPFKVPVSKKRSTQAVTKSNDNGQKKKKKLT